MTWTKFMDMNSGGDLKEKWQYIYIEAPAEKAKIVFYNRFGHNPERITCTCCGEDYSISEGESIEQLRLPSRFEKRKDILIIYAEQIKSEEYEGEVPEQGYVWID